MQLNVTATLFSPPSPEGTVAPKASRCSCAVSTSAHRPPAPSWGTVRMGVQRLNREGRGIPKDDKTAITHPL